MRPSLLKRGRGPRHAKRAIRDQQEQLASAMQGIEAEVATKASTRNAARSQLLRPLKAPSALFEDRFGRAGKGKSPTLNESTQANATVSWPKPNRHKLT